MVCFIFTSKQQRHKVKTKQIIRECTQQKRTTHHAVFVLHSLIVIFVELSLLFFLFVFLCSSVLLSFFAVSCSPSVCFVPFVSCWLIPFRVIDEPFLLFCVALYYLSFFLFVFLCCFCAVLAFRFGILFILSGFLYPSLSLPFFASINLHSLFFGFSFGVPLWFLFFQIFVPFFCHSFPSLLLPLVMSGRSMPLLSSFFFFHFHFFFFLSFPVFSYPFLLKST